ncbi:hypothetical protein D1007_34267 [Hordeum vulgare]|nr:hypothetical protein D1007_34267 [Hordeum vulgare]
MGRTCVYVHHVDKDAFLKGNIDPDPDELDMVFDLCPSYAELLEQVRKDLNWMDPSDVVEFAGRHNVGFRMHIRWKTMRVNSKQRWLAYKDTVAESLDKALELFAMKTNVPNLLDLNRVSSSIVEAIPATINEEASIEPLSCVYEANEEVNIEHEPLVQANYEHYDDGNVLHDNNLGDLDKYNLQETMDHSIPYSRGYASESDDEGPDEEVDEEGFTAKEAEAFTKVLKRDHRTPLFEDLSLADEAVVDGGEDILFGVRPPSHRDTHGKNIILPGSKFETFFELKMWLDEYSVTHYRPHKVVHSNMKLRYTVACEDRGCPWIVRARPWKGGPGWNIVSCMPHMCQGKRVDGALSRQEGDCGVTGHNRRRCTARMKKSKNNDSRSSQPSPSQPSPSQQGTGQGSASQQGTGQASTTQQVPTQHVPSRLGLTRGRGTRGSGGGRGSGGIGRGGARGRGGIGHGGSRGNGGIVGGLTRIGMRGYLQGPFPYGRFSAEQGKRGVGEEKDAASEEQLLMERAAKKLREEDAAEARMKKDEEDKAKRDEEWQMFLEHKRYEARIKENDRKTLEKRKKEYEANFKKMLAEAAAKREREHQRFTERVKEEASKLRKREEEEEEERKKKKGKGPCSTQ